jgi:peptidoglycan/LPS O-acetylase OafA/YrhL
MHYRADIDGLRAVAVLSVVIFHLAPSVLTGGFVGVDIFFVISGFLITGFIADRLSDKSFSLLEFYERRILRLVPAFVVVAVFTLFAGYILYGPEDYQRLSNALKSVLILGANHYFLHTSGYFAPAPETTPLLHTWSLSVEEQFYVIFPFVFILMHRLRVRPLVWMGIFAAISLVWSCWILNKHPEKAFFLLPYRAWEFLLGSLVAVSSLRKIERPQEWLAALGCALIAGSATILSSASTFPGWGALAPCIGAVILVTAGTGTRINRLLASAPVSYLGRLSYSLYLWHWPLICFTEYWIARRIGLTEAVAIGSASLLLASFSYHFIETPFRDRPFPVLKSVGALSALVALLILSIGINAGEGLPGRLPPPFSAFLVKNALKGGMPESECRLAELIALDPRLSPLQNLRNPHVCKIGASDRSPSMILWGDSHAQALAPALDHALRQTSRAGYSITTPGCPPIFGIDRSDNPKYDCRKFNDAVASLIDNIRPASVMLSARWPVYFEQTLYGIENNAAPHVSAPGGEDGAKTMATGVRRTFSWLAKHDLNSFVVGPVPEMPMHVPYSLARQALTMGMPLIEVSLAEVNTRQASSRPLLDALAKEYGVNFIDPLPRLCEQSRCIGGSARGVLFSDNNHLSLVGAMKLAPLLAERMNGGG